MKAIQISRLQATIAITFAILAGLSGPMVRRGLTMLLQGADESNLPAVNPDMGTGFELVGYVTVSAFFVAWAWFVGINRQRHRRAGKWRLCVLPGLIGMLGLGVFGRLRLAGGAVSPGTDTKGRMPVEWGSATVTAIETFWLVAAALSVAMLLYYRLTLSRLSKNGGR